MKDGRSLRSGVVAVSSSRVVSCGVVSFRGAGRCSCRLAAVTERAEVCWVGVRTRWKVGWWPVRSLLLRRDDRARRRTSSWAGWMSTHGLGIIVKARKPKTQVWVQSKDGVESNRIGCPSVTPLDFARAPSYSVCYSHCPASCQAPGELSRRYVRCARTCCQMSHKVA